jgi:hypothetical protein
MPRDGDQLDLTLWQAGGKRSLFRGICALHFKLEGHHGQLASPVRSALFQNL